ncbi:tubulin-dependent ATPase [Martiniozyma asiatica (nom. inval.)]|nr:tubulin-dependent ATPase [Martiniozyma asiatica]
MQPLSVAVRIRPSGQDPNDEALVTVDSKLLVLRQRPASSHNRRHREHRYLFDNIFLQNATQRHIYESTTANLVKSLFDGCNSTIFAYGATGCGKTYTISGTDESPGLIYLATEQIFDEIPHDVSLQLSYLEIYNEKIRDLFLPETPSSHLNLHEKDNAITVTNLTKHSPKSVNDVMQLLKFGNTNRTVSPTAANEVSSRSHAILQITITKTSGDLIEHNSVSTLSIIDLAGSERASCTKNTGIRLHEGANINKSLLALGSCINALCSKSKPHVPYRNSKLTRLLKYSLSGNCKTFMIVCVNSSWEHYEETLNALKYAQRASKIKTGMGKLEWDVEKHVGGYVELIEKQKNLINSLQRDTANTVDQKLSHYKKQQLRILNIIEEEVSSLERRNVTEKSSILGKLRWTSQLNTQLTRLKHTLARFDRDLRFNGLMDLLLNSLDILDKERKELQTKWSDIGQLERVIDDLEVLGNNLKGMPEWDEVCTTFWDQRISLVKAKLERDVYLEAELVSLDTDIGIEGSLSRLLTTVEEGVDSGKLRGFDVIDQSVGYLQSEIERVLGSGGRKRKLEGSTPRKSSRVVSINRGFKGLAIGSPLDSLEIEGDDSVIITQHEEVSSFYGTPKRLDFTDVDELEIDNRLTSKKLAASPNISSPNRLAGIGVSNDVFNLKVGVIPKVD